jgi:hypothetical protein
MRKHKYKKAQNFLFQTMAHKQKKKVCGRSVCFTSCVFAHKKKNKKNGSTQSVVKEYGIKQAALFVFIQNVCVCVL